MAATPPAKPAETGPIAKPALGIEYERWLSTSHGVSNLNAHRNNYETVCRELLDDFQNSTFWKAVLLALPDIDALYLVDNKFPLVSSFEPALLQKPWSSFLEKTYRKNIVENIAFPNPPTAGWCLPPEWYSQIHDIIRTAVVVKYIDGVPLVLRQLQDIATGANLVCEADLETREDGYYGAHFSLEKKCQISTMDWSKETRDVRLEIQITTQIKDVIKSLLHTYYESRRTTGVRPRLSDIAWNYREDEFVATYLGHILHYVEGMIIEVRDRRRGRDA